MHEMPATTAEELLDREMAGLTWADGEIATMVIDGKKLYAALEAEMRAHQQLVNIGEELKTVHKAKRKPDEDEISRLRQACQALAEAGKAFESILNTR